MARTKANLWDRFWQWAVPLTESEVRESEAYVELMREQARTVRLENDAREAELKAAMEAEALAREKATRFVTVASTQIPATYTQRFKSSGREVVVELKIYITLRRNSLGDRTYTLGVDHDLEMDKRLNSDDRTLVDFLATTDVMRLLVEPWVEGVIDDEAIRNSNCFEFPGELIASKQAKAA